MSILNNMKFNGNEKISRNRSGKLTSNFRYESDHPACTYIRALIDIIVLSLSRVRQRLNLQIKPAITIK